MQLPNAAKSLLEQLDGRRFFSSGKNHRLGSVVPPCTFPPLELCSPWFELATASPRGLSFPLSCRCTQAKAEGCICQATACRKPSPTRSSYGCFTSSSAWKPNHSSRPAVEPRQQEGGKKIPGPARIRSDHARTLPLTLLLCFPCLAQLAPAVGHRALIICRDIEW